MPQPAPPADPVLTRRAVLAGAAALAVLPSAIGATGPAAAAAPVAGENLTIHLVDGWVLTSEDLKALGLHAH